MVEHRDPGEQSAADVIAEALVRNLFDRLKRPRPPQWCARDEFDGIMRAEAAAVLAALEAAGWAVVAVDDLRQVLRNGVDWTDDHGPAVRLADAVNAAVTHRSAREADQ